MNFLDMYRKIAEIDRPSEMNERVTFNPDGTPTPSFADQMRANGAQPSPEPAQPAVTPLNKRFDPRFKNGPEPYTIDIAGTVYKFAGRDKSGPGTGEVIKVPAAVIGIRGLGAVSVELGKDGMYYPAAANESTEEDQPLDEVAQLRASLGLGYFPGQVDESCSMPGDMASIPKQSDSVSMNVSLNASGSGGIKDLMGILKGIEQGHTDTDHPSHDTDSGKDVIIGGDDFPFDEEFANAPEEAYAPVDAVIPSGDDLHGQGSEAPKVNGGGNPMQETLMNQLSRLYTEVKEGKKDDFDPLKHVKKPNKGVKAAAKDVNRGDYGARTALMKAGGVKDDRGPKGVTQG